MFNACATIKRFTETTTSSISRVVISNKDEFLVHVCSVNVDLSLNEVLVVRQVIDEEDTVAGVIFI
jgi:hypothetical protein